MFVKSWISVIFNSFFTLWRRRRENFALLRLSTLAKRNFEVQNKVKLSPEAENMVGKDLRAPRSGGENRWGKFFGLQKLVGNSPPFPTCRWGKCNTGPGGAQGQGSSEGLDGKPEVFRADRVFQPGVSQKDIYDYREALEVEF